MKSLPVFTSWRLSAGALLIAAVLAGCATSPRPPAASAAADTVPSKWSVATPNAEAAAAMPTDWEQWVTDARLRQVITLSLANNRDLRVAVLSIEKARAAYQIQEAAQLPTVNATGSAANTRTPAQASSTGQSTLTRTFSVGLGVTSYELDLFGRVRSLKDAALASYLNTEQAQQSTRLTLVAEVTHAWLTLASNQRQLALATQTLESQRATYALTEKRQALGADSGLTLAQTQTSVESARVSALAYANQVERDRLALELLVGRRVPDEWLPNPETESSATGLVAVPAGLPSTVLERRPDVRAAAFLVQSTDASLEAARAARYPSISLTGSAGTASRSLTDLFKGGAWSFIPSVSWPLFDHGAVQAGIREAQAARDIQIATYEKTLLSAFQEVADALTVRSSLSERLAAQQALVQATQKSFDLAQARHRAGADTYLTVLDAQRSLYSAQQALIALQLTEQANRVTLYKVLGGGWG